MPDVHPHRLVVALLTSIAVSAGALSASAPTAWAAASSGEAAKAPKQIFLDAKKATESAKTARVVGSLVPKSKTGASSFNLVVGHGGGGGVVRLGSGSAMFDLVVRGTTQYLKADAATWSLSAGSKSVGTAFANHWVKTGTTDIPTFTLSHVADITWLPTNLSYAPSKKAVTTFHGQRAIKLTDRSGDAIYVAATGTPYLLAVVTSSGSYVYSGYDTVAPPAVPNGPYFNGEAFKTSQAIFADAEAATEGAKTVHVTGSFPAKTATSGSRFDVVAGHGVGGGTVGIGTGSAQFSLVNDGKNLYLKADAATWTLSTGSQDAGKVLGGKWIKTTGIKGFSLGNFLSLDYLVSTLTAKNLSVTGITTFSGQEAVQLSDGKGDSFYVAAEGSPYIVALVSATAKEYYSDYNAASVPPAPAHAVSASSVGLGPS